MTPPDPAGPLDELLTPTRTGERSFAIVVPDGWLQGRGVFGGFVVATLVRAMERELADASRPLRSLTATLCGPLVPGPATIQTELLRSGSAVSSIAARLDQDGVVAHAVGVHGRARAGDAPPLLPASPEPKAWRDVAAIDAPGAPPFTKFFEFRPLPPWPFSRTSDAQAHGWIRPRNPGPTRDAAFVVATIDAWWPGLLAMLDRRRPVATIAFTFQLLLDPATLDPDAPLHHRAQGIATHEGHYVEQRELWSPDGRLVALNQQTFVLIR